MKKNAFTFAEVLITLAILGIIAALTIPNLIQCYNERVNITKLRKTYTYLENTFNQAVAENGSVVSWFVHDTNYNKNMTNIYNIMKSYFKVSDECTPNNGNCFAPFSEYKNIKGEASFVSNFADSYGNDKILTLNDGVSIWFHANTRVNCVNGEYCFAVYIDVNGAKAPNKLGVDLFSLYAINGQEGRQSSLHPNCSIKLCERSQSVSPNNGQGCTCWAIYKGNMDYLRRDIPSAEWSQ